MSGLGGDGFKQGNTQSRTINRPATYSPFAALPRGPEVFANREHPILPSGPGEPPPGFVRAGTSASEWMVYWALSKIYSDPKHPRQPPFEGSRDPSIWVYQKPYGKHQLVGARIDFVVAPFTIVPILIRLQTEFFHIYSPPKRHTYDRIQEIALGKYGRVADLFDQQILGDRTGTAAILALKALIAGANEIDPLQTGQAKRVRVRQ